jgi:hypothetical protein
MKKIYATLVCLCFVLTTQAQLAIIYPDKDNTLYQIPTGAFSNGVGEYLFTGTDINGREQRTVMSFDIAGNVPGGATIDSVRLTIQVSVANSGSESIGIHPLTTDWGEGTSDATGGEEAGAPSTNNDATWVHNFWPGSTWTTQGGDFNVTSSATTTVAGPGSYEWESATVVSDVQGWLDTPASNFGWMVKYTSGGGFKRFYSKDNAVPSLRPTLHIYYSTGSNNPPVITAEPIDSTICYYDTASFTVAGTDILGYQWQEFSFNWSNVVNGGLYSGANSATLYLSGPSPVYDGYRYRCITTGLAAPDDTSGEATLNVVDCIGVGVIENNYGNISLYPNPANDQLFIDLGNVEEPLTLDVIAVDGRIVFSKTLIQPLNTIDVSKFATGIYHAVLTGDSGTKNMRFIVK